MPHASYMRGSTGGFSENRPCIIPSRDDPIGQSDERINDATTRCGRSEGVSRTMVSPKRGWSRASFVIACLIIVVSAIGMCGNVVWKAPPRFDGAGYAVLARAWLAGEGYRAIDHPDRPRHAHFPPGYPAILAVVWRWTGESSIVAHRVSVVCAVGATLAAWLWFRRVMSGPAATLLGLALGVNWLWLRTGGTIQSEPLYLLLGQLTILAAWRSGRSTTTLTRDAIVLGVLLGACLLTRHASIGLVAAVLVDLALRRGWRAAVLTALVAALLFTPWLTWLASVGQEGRTQAGLLVRGEGTWLDRIVGQLVFYVRRIPDQIIGPFVEVATVFGRSRLVAIAADAWAVITTLVIAGGWYRTLSRPQRRLAGMIAVGTILVLLVWPFTEAGRFLVPLIPCILIGAVEGLAVVLGWFLNAARHVAGRWREPSGRPFPSSFVRLSRRRVIAAGLVFAVSVPYSAYMLVKGRARAMESSHVDFDEACVWLGRVADRPGPVLTRHPGEVFWQTGRQSLEVPTSERPGDLDADSGAIARTIARYRVAYLLIDRERYALAPQSPLARFVVEHSERVRKVWGRESDDSAVAIYEVTSAENSTP